MSRLFDGVDDVLNNWFVSVPSTTDWTMTLWARAASEGEGGGGYFLSFGVNYIVLAFNNPGTNAIVLKYYAGTAESSIAGANDTVVLDTWQHFQMRYRVSDTTLELLIDGVSVGTSTTDPGTGSLGQLFVGAQNTGGSLAFDGDLAEMKIWTNARLTTNELMAVRMGKVVRPASLYLHWPMYGLDSPEPDLSGVPLNASITSAPTRSPHPPQAPYSKIFWGGNPLTETAASAVFPPLLGKIIRPASRRYL